jgi:hypothetical protein
LRPLLLCQLLHTCLLLLPLLLRLGLMWLLYCRG